ncbi:UNVERIFIED_CONTAM: hypothetical protein FKN15_039441 [Acipenser sinensis]
MGSQNYSSVWINLSSGTENRIWTSEPSIYAEYDKGRIDFFPENASFLLRNLQKSDEGMYRITQDQKIKDSRLYKLCVMEKLVISRKDAVENCSITLSCNITVEGPCRWLKDGGNISHGIFHLSNNQEITLDGTRTDVWGTYTCISGYQTVDYLLQSVPGEKCNVRESLTKIILPVIFTVAIAVVAVFMLFLWKVAQENLVFDPVPALARPVLGDPASPGSPQSGERHSLASRTRQVPIIGLAPERDHWSALELSDAVVGKKRKRLDAPTPVLELVKAMRESDTKYMDFMQVQMQAERDFREMQMALDREQRVVDASCTEHCACRVHRAPCAPSTVCTECTKCCVYQAPVHRAPHAPGIMSTEGATHTEVLNTMHTEHRAHRALCTPSTMHTEHRAHRAPCTPSTVHTEHRAHRVPCTEHCMLRV